MRRVGAVVLVVFMLVAYLWTRPVAEAQVWTYGGVVREAVTQLGGAERLRLLGIVFGSGAAVGTAATSLTLCVSTVWCGAVVLAAGLLAGALVRYYVEASASGLPVSNSSTWYNQDGRVWTVTRTADSAVGTGFAPTFYGCSIGANTGMVGQRFSLTATGGWKWPDGQIVGCGPCAALNISQLMNLWACARPGPAYSTYPGNPSDAEALSQMKTKRAADPTAVESKFRDLVATLPDDQAGVEGKGVTLAPPYGQTEPDPGPGPIPESPTDAPTQGSQKGLFEWLVDSFQAWFSYLYGQIQTLTKAVTDLPQLIWEKFEGGLQTLFVPTQTSFDNWQALKDTVVSKPPWSLLPPTSLFPDPGAGTCSLAAITIDGTPTLGASLSLEWPEFVCTAVGWFRTFLKGALFLILGWWIIDRVYPRVHV